MTDQFLEALGSGLPLNTDYLPIVLVLLSMGAGLIALWPRRSAATTLNDRLKAVVSDEGPRQTPAHGEKDRRRRAVEDTLREMAAKEKSRARRKTGPTFVGRMRQAGLRWSRFTYFLVTLFCGFSAFAGAVAVANLGAFASLGFALAAGLLLPHMYVGFRRKRRLAAFGNEFPDALDTIVRGIQAGLPLADCLSTIANEAQEPVRTEFRGIMHDQTMGLPLPEAVERLADRVPLSEISFFAIVLTIQSRTGGNLSEALSNLCKVLRDRKKMRGKIKAMSTEAKASAAIIGAMPPVVAILLYFVSRDYITLLFTTDIGNIALISAGIWMLIGTLIMRKMINFDF